MERGDKIRVKEEYRINEQDILRQMGHKNKMKLNGKLKKKVDSIC